MGSNNYQEDWQEYILINVGFNQVTEQYSCTAIKTNRQGAEYAFRNNYGIVVKKGLSLYVVTSNFGIKRAVADNLCVMHATGKFHKEDMGDWN